MKTFILEAFTTILNYTTPHNKCKIDESVQREEINNVTIVFISAIVIFKRYVPIATGGRLSFNEEIWVLIFHGDLIPIAVSRNLEPLQPGILGCYTRMIYVHIHVCYWFCKKSSDESQNENTLNSSGY